MKKYAKPLTSEEIAELPDASIEYSDIPELDEDFWEHAQIVMPETKERITLRLDKETVEFFRRGGHGYQTRINAVLRAYVDAQQATPPKRSSQKAHK